MKNSVKLLFAACMITILAGTSAFAANFSRTSAAVESVLRQSLQLPIGPATQFISFYIPNNGLFIVVTTDFSMRPAAETPFGPAKSKGGNMPNPAAIRNAMKNAILHCKKMKLPKGKNESLFVILANRALFSRPGENRNNGITYKAYITIQKLTSGTNPAASIVME
ncbi:MAG: hypothetical protein GXO69_09940 [Acidobacteria bacterium]|nr:hypothetical protein [Acidobacteriota bacterium]